MAQQQYDAWVEDLVATKYRLVVAGQVYGRNRKSRVLKHAWDAYAIDLLLHRFPGMRLSYIDTENLASGTQQYVVMVRASSMHTTKRIQEVYRIKVPQNPFTKRGVIIGEGKPENQNCAMQFCFGECL